MSEVRAEHLDYRCLVRIGGGDAFSFLQGLLTQDLGSVHQGGLKYALMLTPQGRFFADFFVFYHEGSYYLDLDSNRLDEIIAKLRFYKLRSCVEIESIPEMFVGVCEKPQVLPLFFKDPRHESLGYRFYHEEGNWEGEASSYQHRRFLTSVIEPSLCGMEVGKSIPFEYNMDFLNTLSFSKGCYLGQELMARTHFLGTVRKRIVCFEVERPLDAGKSILTTRDGEEAGRVVASFQNLLLCKIRNCFLNHSLFVGHASLRLVHSFVDDDGHT